MKKILLIFLAYESLVKLIPIVIIASQPESYLPLFVMICSGLAAAFGIWAIVRTVTRKASKFELPYAFLAMGAAVALNFFYLYFFNESTLGFMGMLASGSVLEMIACLMIFAFMLGWDKRAKPEAQIAGQASARWKGKAPERETGSEAEPKSEYSPEIKPEPVPNEKPAKKPGPPRHAKEKSAKRKAVPQNKETLRFKTPPSGEKEEKV